MDATTEKHHAWHRTGEHPETCFPCCRERLRNAERMVKDARDLFQRWSDGGTWPLIEGGEWLELYVDHMRGHET